MLHNYGWLMVYGNVDHPSVEKRGGDVYIHKDDVVLDESLSTGDLVTFYLYADDQGSGICAIGCKEQFECLRQGVCNANNR